MTNPVPATATTAIAIIILFLKKLWSALSSNSHEVHIRDDAYPLPISISAATIIIAITTEKLW